ncbi:MAG: OmpA family protein [Leptospiraceae bacterium]|nr:OmpA family protein [Leptospiraceae bacterium]
MSVGIRIAIFTILLGSCTAQIEDPFAIRIFQISGRGEVPVLIGRESDQCKAILEHRVYYWPYVVPLTNWKEVQEHLKPGGRYRYRTILKTWDVLLLIPMGLLGFSSQTHVLEECPHTDLPLLYGAQRASLADYAVYFDVNSTQIRPDQLEKLEKVAALSQRNPSFVFMLLGQTDVAGQESINQSLSLRRAEAVRDRLIALGVPRRNLRVAAAGSELAGMAQKTTGESDRRVEMILIVE